MHRASGGGTFLTAAEQGMFAIDTEAATQLMNSLTEIRGSLIERRMQMLYLKKQVMLGDLLEAQAIAKLDAQVASGDQQSLEFVLQRFVDVLDHVHQAVESCVRRYKHDDEQAAQDFQRISER